MDRSSYRPASTSPGLYGAAKVRRSDIVAQAYMGSPDCGGRNARGGARVDNGSETGSREDTMAIEIRRDHEIYRKEGDWFTARWHFSFDEYRDPGNMGFGNMRVFNDDRLVPGAIWPLHPHRNIEGLTYVVEGTFRHEDDVGGAPGPLPAGAVQRMTLGSGAWHSEQNASDTEPMRFIQMWIVPAARGLTPGVE